jgi:hypothetical protein
MIPFYKPYLTGQELGNILKAHDRGMLARNGYFTKECLITVGIHVGSQG